MNLELASAVRTAWREALADSPDDPALAWAEAGGDSLATLHLVYRLEQLLGRALSFELVQPEMRPHELVAALGEAVRTPSGDAPCVFLLPGQYGDEPSLAAFRLGFAGRLRFEVIPSPGLDTPAAVLGNLAAIGRQAAAAIDALQPSGPLLLAGYSFGGSVAVEAAAALVAAGRNVALVAVLDAAFGSMPRGSTLRRQLRLGVGKAALRIVSFDGARRLGLTVADWLTPRRALTIRRLVLRRFRTEARLRWQPLPAQTRAFVAISDEFAPHTADRWPQLFADCEMLRLPTTHHGLIRGDAVAPLSVAFERAVMAAVTAG